MDPGGASRTHVPPVGPIFLCLCICQEKLAKIIGWHPHFDGWYPLLREILYQPLELLACWPKKDTNHNDLAAESGPLSKIVHEVSKIICLFKEGKDKYWLEFVSKGSNLCFEENSKK